MNKVNMVHMDGRRLKKTFLQAVKIAVGSSLAIFLASELQLEYATSAGGITLLTIVTTKWETIKLSLARLITLVIAIAMGSLIFSHLNSEWLSYGIFVFLIVMICELFGWKATISVNAVIGTHFLMASEYDAMFILNEFLLISLGIMIALILNLFYNYRSQKSEIIKNMRDTEHQMQAILGEVAAYLLNKDMQGDVWQDIHKLGNQLKSYSMGAYEYQNNTFQSHPGYYIDYFEMRTIQLTVLDSLCNELKKIRNVPKQARVIAEYMLYLTDYVIEINAPTKQIERLQQIFKDMENEPLPVTRGEFENRAMLFHILMDLEEFLNAKQRFVEELDEKKLKLYWEKDM